MRMPPASYGPWRQRAWHLGFVAGHGQALAETNSLLNQSRREVLTDARADFERTLAVLREENSTLRRMLEAADRRVDALTTDFVKSLATSAAPSPPPAAPPAGRTSTDPIEGLGNVFAPVDYKHPDATFTNERAASLMAAEDEDDGAAHAA